MKVERTIRLKRLQPKIDHVFDLAAAKLRAIDRRWDFARGAPVFTATGKYTTRGWTAWTEGFLYGAALYCFDATDDRQMLEQARDRIVQRMPQHVTHIGVHDHAFNNLSTFGNLRRLMRERRIADVAWERRYYDLALHASGAVQAARWQGIRVDTPSKHSAGCASLDTSTRSTARTRCSSIRCARRASWVSRGSSGRC